MLWSPDCVFDIKKGSLTILQGTASKDDYKFAIDFISSTTTTHIKDFKVQFELQISKEVYLDKVNTLKGHIQRGDIYEINFCQEYLAKGIEKEDIKTAIQI